MVILLIIVSYVVSVFITRYFDFKSAERNKGIYFRQSLNKGLWFLPLANILYSGICFFAILDIDIDNNRYPFIQWFFLTHNYKTKEEIKVNRELDELFQKQSSKIKSERFNIQ